VCDEPTSVDSDEGTICSCGRLVCNGCILPCRGCPRPCCEYCVLDSDDYERMQCQACAAVLVDPVLRERVGRFVDALPDASTENPCSICMGEVEPTDDVVAPLKCLHLNHNFRRECLCTWFEMGQLTCPMCREPFVLPP
jgi:hypothetical protein